MKHNYKWIKSMTCIYSACIVYNLYCIVLIRVALPLFILYLNNIEQEKKQCGSLPSDIHCNRDYFTTTTQPISLVSQQ